MAWSTWRRLGVYAFCIGFGFDRLGDTTLLSGFAALVIGSAGGGFIYLVATRFLASPKSRP